MPDPREGQSEASAYVVDLDVLRRDVRLAVGDTGQITLHSPCWKCGAIQPAHYCGPERTARVRLLQWAGTAGASSEHTPRGQSVSPQKEK